MKMSRLEAGVRVVLEFIEAANRHDIAGIVQIMSDDCTFESAGPAPDGTAYSGREAISQFWQEFFRRSPDARIEIEEIFGFGMQCVLRWRCDEMEGSGQTSHLRGLDLFQVQNGLICEQLSYVKSSSRK